MLFEETHDIDVDIKPGVKQWILVAETNLELNECLQYMKGHRVIAIDTETTWNYRSSYADGPGSGALRKDNILLGISMSVDDKSGIYIPICKSGAGDLFWDTDTTKKIIRWFSVLFKSNSRFFLHNALFDMDVLKRFIGCRPKLLNDTLIAAHELDENRNLGLKSLGVSLLGADADQEKRELLEEFKKIGESRILMGQLERISIAKSGKYAAKDTILTFALRNKFAPELVAQRLQERYKFKRSMLPVYEEINEQGWTVDEEVLVNNGKDIAREIQELATGMRNCLSDKITPIEADVLDKAQEIKNSPAWKKLIIDAESLHSFFTVPTEGRLLKSGARAPAPKDAGKFTTGAKYVNSFLTSGYSTGTMTEEFLLWDGDLSTMSAECEELCRSIQRDTFLKKKTETAKKEGKIVIKTIFNVASNKQVCELLFNSLKLEVIKTTNSGDPDVSSEMLQRLQARLINNNLPSDVADALKGLPRDDTDPLWKRRIKHINDHMDTNGKKDELRAVIFLEYLLKFRDDHKMYGTYVNGIVKLLYTAEDLRRTPEFSPLTGNQLKYLISNVNMCGTKTGRPSCVLFDTDINTSTGTRSMGTVVHSFNNGVPVYVATHKNRQRKVISAWNNGTQAVYKVTTKSGKTITSTLNHKYLTDKNGTVWKTLDKLKVGDKLYTCMELKQGN